MEPMVESPGKSPVPSNQYFPSFLMGELASCSPQTSSPLPSSTYSRSSRRGPEGPPIVGLFDELPSPSVNETSVANTPENNIPKLCSVDSYWVVVFGFLPSQVNEIIAMFSQLGPVAEHNYHVNANWVCLRYTTQADMRKALSMNAKILSGNVMIGVTERKQQHFRDSKNRPCYHTVCCVHDFKSDSNNNDSSPCLSHSSPESHLMGNYESGATGSPVGVTSGSAGVNSSFGTPGGNMSVMTSTTSPRPLAISKRLIAQSPVSQAPVPTADTSFVGKFMDLIFS